MKKIENFIQKNCGISVLVYRCKQNLYEIYVGSKKLMCGVEYDPFDNTLVLDEGGNPIFKISSPSYNMIPINGYEANIIKVQYFLLTNKSIRDMFFEQTRQPMC